MNIKLAIAALLVFMAGGAEIVRDENSKTPESDPLGRELAALRQAYDQGAIDEKRYRARTDILLTTWELRVGERHN